jgi:hypothetical protein
MPLYRLLYQSKIALNGSQPEIDRKIETIVSTSAKSNAATGLSGALIASGGVFIQALEGPLGALETTFEKICTDRRHKRVTLIELAAAEERVFSEWAMIRVAQGAEVLDICTVIGAHEPRRLDASTTTALVSLMRSILLTKTASSMSEATGFAV